MGDRPDPVVREAEARESVRRLTEGFVADAHSAGVLPPMREIEKVAQEVTDRVIKRHEEAAAKGLLDEKPAPNLDPASPARLDRGEFLDEAELGKAQKIERKFDPERHAAKTRKLVPASEQFEAVCARARLDYLLSWERHEDGSRVRRFPDWAEKCHRAWVEAARFADRLGMDEKSVESIAADALLKVLDDSDVVFARDLGPWRTPKTPPRILGVNHTQSILDAQRAARSASIARGDGRLKR